MLKFLERYSEWKKMVKELPAKEANEMLFEFYRINCDWITDTNPPGGMTLEMCQPPHKRATLENLASICALHFGAGAFVALEVNEGLDGLPLSYWLIKVKASDQCSSKRVFLDEQQLRPYRQIRHLIPTEEEGAMTLDEGRPYWAAGLGEANIFWQRGAEAALAAHQLHSLPDPQPQESKETPQVRYAKELIKSGMKRQDILEALKKRRTEFWPNFADDEAAVEKNAETAYESARRALRQKQTVRRKKRVVHRKS